MKLSKDEFDHGAKMTSSPMNTNAPMQFPPNAAAAASKKINHNPWDVKKSAPVVLTNQNPHHELEFHVQPHATAVNAKQAYFHSNGPVDVDEAIQGDQNFVTAIGDQNDQWSQQEQQPLEENNWATANDNAWGGQDPGWTTADPGANANEAWTEINDNGWQDDQAANNDAQNVAWNDQGANDAWNQQDNVNGDLYATVAGDQAYGNEGWQTADQANTMYETPAAIPEEEQNAWGGEDGNWQENNENPNAGWGENDAAWGEDFATPANDENVAEDVDGGLKDENTFETANFERGEYDTAANLEDFIDEQGNEIVDQDQAVTAFNEPDAVSEENEPFTSAIGDEEQPVEEVEADGDREDAITPKPPEWVSNAATIPTAPKQPSPRKLQSFDMNLNVDGAMNSTVSSESSTSQFVPPPFLRQKSSWLYQYAWSRRTSDASSFISGAQEIEDLYFDDEVNPNLENDPNMMLTEAHRNAAFRNNNDINFPEKPCLTDRGEFVHFEIFFLMKNLF